MIAAGQKIYHVGFASVIGLILFGTPLLSEHNVNDALKEAQRLFQKDECSQAIQKLDNVPFEAELNRASLKSALVILGVCHFQVGEKSKAESNFKSLLYLDPKFELNPFRTPPGILNFFEQQKVKIQKSLKSIEAVKKLQTFDRNSSNLKLLPSKKKSAINYAEPFIPFGFSQFKNGDSLKGSIFLTSELVLLGTNIGSYWWKRSTTQNGLGSSVQSKEDFQNYNIAQALQITSISLLVATYVYSIIDAFINYL